MNPGTGTPQYELVALSPVSGAANWKLAITGTMVSEPCVGQGRQDLHDCLGLRDERPDPVRRRDDEPGTATASTGKSRLIIVTAYATMATITATITTDSNVLSAPKIADDAGSYVVYVTGFEMGVDDKDSVASGQKTLYAFTPAGATKFSVKLN